MAFAKDEQGIERDEQGRVRAVKTDQHVLDPNSPEAVQIPIGVSDVDPLSAAYDTDDVQPVIDNNVKVGDLSHDEITGAGQHGPSKLVERVAEAEAEAQSEQADEAAARAKVEAKPRADQRKSDSAASKSD